MSKLSGQSQRGLALRRLEDARFLTGQARYTDDIQEPRQAYAHIVRSPHAHATITGIDATAARAMPGVLGVFTAADLTGLGPIPCVAKPPTIGPMLVPARYALASDRVRHVGEPVAFVIAETATAARDAAEAIDVAYDPLPVVTDLRAAQAVGAPQLWPDIPSNFAFRFEKGDRAATQAALAQAAHIVELEVINNRLIIAPIEPRAALATHDAASDTFHLLFAGQGVHSLQKQLADLFHVSPEKMHLSCPDVGGGFGVKNALYPELIIVLWAARHLHRPVRWTSGHAEDFVSTAQGRDNINRGRLGIDSAGKFLALDVFTLANMGAAMSTGGPGSSTIAPGNAMGAGYNIPAVFMETHGVFTNTVPIDAYRGAGKPEANYLIERLIEAAAPIVGIDAIELRRRNLVSAFPHRTAMSTTIDGGIFAGNIAPALARANHAGFPARRASSEARGLLRGIGVTCFMETARGSPDEGAEVKFLQGGKIALALGTQSNGQGHETSFPQIAADHFGLPIETFILQQADTALVPAGNGHGGARSLHQGGAALVRAMDAAIEKGRTVAARLLQTQPDQVTYAEGAYHADGTSVGLLEVAQAATQDENLDSYIWNKLDLITFPNGVHIAEVEIDPETGQTTLLRYTAVDDFGATINPLLTIGQIQGGVAQGIGQAMLEHTVYDPETGQLLSGSFMDYTLPRAADLPNFDIHLNGVPTNANPLGVKGAGQAGAIAAPQAIIAAILNALAPLGVSHIDMPATPERVWQAIQAA